MNTTQPTTKQELSEKIEEMCALAARLYDQGDHDRMAEVDAEVDSLMAAYETI